jgi:hypothetical protein
VAYPFLCIVLCASAIPHAVTTKRGYRGRIERNGLNIRLGPLYRLSDSNVQYFVSNERDFRSYPTYYSLHYAKCSCTFCKMRLVSEISPAYLSFMQIYVRIIYFYECHDTVVFEPE